MHSLLFRAAGGYQEVMLSRLCAVGDNSAINMADSVLEYLNKHERFFLQKKKKYYRVRSGCKE